MSKNIWDQPAPVIEKPGPSPQPAEEQSAEEVVMEVRRQLYARGWCLLECSALNGDTIVVVIDESITGFPAGYPVYTVAELEELGEGPPLNDQMLLMAHTAKKRLGAKVEAIHYGNHKQ